MRGRERLAGREALPASGGLERVVVAVGTATNDEWDPLEHRSVGRGVVDAARPRHRERVGERVLERLVLPLAKTRADTFDEAAGVEMLVRGLQAQHDSDDALLAASCAFFDTLYAALLLVK